MKYFTKAKMIPPIAIHHLLIYIADARYIRICLMRLLIR